MEKNKVILRTTKTSSMRKMKTKTNRTRKTMRVFSLGHEERKPESTHVTIMEPPNMVDGVISAWRALMSSTSWSRKTGYAHGLLRWKSSFWNVPFGTLLIASKEVKNSMWQGQLLESWSMCKEVLFNQRGSQMMRVLLVNIVFSKESKLGYDAKRRN